MKLSFSCFQYVHIIFKISRSYGQTILDHIAGRALFMPMIVYISWVVCFADTQIVVTGDGVFVSGGKRPLPGNQALRRISGSSEGF